MAAATVALVCRRSWKVHGEVATTRHDSKICGRIAIQPEVSPCLFQQVEKSYLAMILPKRMTESGHPRSVNLLQDKSPEQKGRTSEVASNASENRIAVLIASMYHFLRSCLQQAALKKLALRDSLTTEDGSCCARPYSRAATDLDFGTNALH
eukprot:4656329-Pleurochrysis_carterae.AAC.2